MARSKDRDRRPSGGIRSRLREAGIRPKRRFAQHFLTDRGILERIVQQAGIQPKDTVVEIGAGTGDLTQVLAERAKRVIALEVDEGLVGMLKERFSREPKVDVLQQDAMEWPLPDSLEALGRPIKVIGNLPYNVATQILLRFCQFPHHLDLLAVMLQREVAQRIVSDPGTSSYGALTLSLRVHWESRIGIRVGPGAFHPRPKVESALLIMTPLEGPRVDVGDWGVFRRIVRACFDQRRKMLRNALKSLAAMDSKDVKEVLEKAQLDGSLRGEELSIEDFARLSTCFIQWRSERGALTEEESCKGGGRS